MKFLFSAFIILVGMLTEYAQEKIDFRLAATCFHELDSLSSIDNGNLWGVRLYGPTMLVFPDSRLIIANQADGNNTLVKQDGYFTGKLPESINMANTAMEWNGVKWTMVMWDAIAPHDRIERDRLLIHESWHRVQKEIGIASVSSANPHLDELQGTVLFKLELFALNRAFQSPNQSGIEMNLKNAIIIRRYRQCLFPGNNENLFERHEGLAEYTGYKLCGLPDSVLDRIISRKVKSALMQEGFTNSFAYLTGPAYGLLFDRLGIKWIEMVHAGKSMPDIALARIGYVSIPADTIQLKALVDSITGVFHAEPIIRGETEYFRKQMETLKAYRKKILGDSQLIVPNQQVNFSFNPMEKLIPVDQAGVIYRTARLTAGWGILEVKNGIFRSNDWQYFVVQAPRTIHEGDNHEADYDLMLNPGWKIVRIDQHRYTLQHNP